MWSVALSKNTLFIKMDCLEDDYDNKSIEPLVSRSYSTVIPSGRQVTDEGELFHLTIMTVCLEFGLEVSIKKFLFSSLYSFIFKTVQLKGKRAVSQIVHRIPRKWLSRYLGDEPIYLQSRAR